MGATSSCQQKQADSIVGFFLSSFELEVQFSAKTERVHRLFCLFSWQWRQNFLPHFTTFVRLSVLNPAFSHYLSFFFFLLLCPSFCVFTSINLFRGPSIIHLPSREVFPEGKLLWRPAWPRTASDWPSACLPFCILHCLFNKEQSECDFQGRVPVIVALTPCLSNDPHYGASDSSLKGLIYEYAGTVAPQASTHQP